MNGHAWVFEDFDSEEYDSVNAAKLLEDKQQEADGDRLDDHRREEHFATVQTWVVWDIYFSVGIKYVKCTKRFKNDESRNKDVVNNICSIKLVTGNCMCLIFLQLTHRSRQCLWLALKGATIWQKLMGLDLLLQARQVIPETGREPQMKPLKQKCNSVLLTILLVNEALYYKIFFF